MDPYAPCPCGSGKKLKFCCQEIVGEMEKIERLQENNQPRMALQLLEKIEKSHPENSWIATHKGLALIDDQRSDEAAESLLRFLHTDPNHPFANAIYAIASYNAEGYPESKKAVHRAFRRSIRQFPELVATLAASIAGNYLAEASYMAAREHMAFALRIGNDEQRRQSVLALLELDGDSAIPYPMRGAHRLPEFGDDGGADATRKARKLAACGCFQEAADMLESDADGSSSPQVQHAIGLLRAWDGDESAAAAALHRAGDAYEDFEQGVECETLAQLLEQMLDENTAKMRLRRYRIESVSQLLTVLDSTNRLERVVQVEEPQKQDGDPVARYLVLDRDLPSESELGELTSETTPQSLARVTIFDKSDDDPALVFVTALEGEPLQKSVELLETASGDLITPADVEDAEDGEEVEIVGVVPREHLPWFRNYYLPPKTPGVVRRRVQAGHWESIVGDEWINTPQASLDGRSPQDAASDGSDRVKLAAAVHVLDVFCGTRGYICPVSDLRKRLGLPEPEPLELREGQPLTTLSLMELRRLNLESVPEAELFPVMKRALLVRHPGWLYEVMRYALDHEVADQEAPSPQDACGALADLCRDSLRRDEALEWVGRGLELAGGDFEPVLQWKMRELMLRIDDPSDPARDGLLNELWQTYGAKLPQLREHLSELVTVLDIEPPWDTAILTPSGVPGGGVWSAAESGAAAGEKKLWLPGDD